MQEIRKTTKILKANESNSLRVTIPKNVVEAFGLKAGDEVLWALVAEGNSFKVGIGFNTS